MKKLLLALIVTASFAVGSLNVIADPPSPPDPGGGGGPSGSGGVPVGAPIDSGVYVLISFGVAYGLGKIYELRKKEVQKE